MKISVITVTIDNDDTLRRTMESVRAQTYGDIEHIVVDGNSDARSHDFFKDFPETSVFAHEALGIYEAINFGISKATGDIIGLLHGGDEFASEKIIESVARIFKEEKLDFAYGDISYKNFNKGKTTRIYHSSSFRPDYLAFGMAPAHPSLYIRKDVQDSIGLYRENFKRAADLDMWMRIFSEKSLKSRYIPLIFVNMASGGLSTSLKSRIIYNNVEKLKTLSANGYQANPLKLAAKYFIILRDSLFDPRKKLKNV